MDMQISHTEQIGELIGALSKAQGTITSALKNKKNAFFKSSYADLPAVWDACRAPLSNNGLAIVQMIEGSEDKMYLVTILGHSSNQWIKSKLPIILGPKKDQQALGSCITYARRYALSAMVGICQDDDDDGEKAVQRDKNKVDVDEASALIAAFLSSHQPAEHKTIVDFLYTCVEHSKRPMRDILDYYRTQATFNTEYAHYKSLMAKT